MEVRSGVVGVAFPSALQVVVKDILVSVEDGFDDLALEVDILQGLSILNALAVSATASHQDGAEHDGQSHDIHLVDALLLGHGS